MRILCYEKWGNRRDWIRFWIWYIVKLIIWKWKISVEKLLEIKNMVRFLEEIWGIRNIKMIFKVLRMNVLFKEIGFREWIVFWGMYKWVNRDDLFLS